MLNWHGYEENENTAILITDFTHQSDKKIYLNGFDQNKSDINHAQNEYLHTRNIFAYILLHKTCTTSYRLYTGR